MMKEENLKSSRILIVDDQEANVLLLERLLQMAGYSNFISTTDPRQVLPLFGKFQPDLILLDLMMPHLDGYAVMQQIGPRFLLSNSLLSRIIVSTPMIAFARTFLASYIARRFDPFLNGATRVVTEL